ncbi:MAG: peptidase M20, partial [Bacteroidota bacterium]
SIGGNAERTPMSWPLAKKITAAMQQVSTDNILQVPTLGGSLPLEAFVKVLGANFLIVPIANADNNQHAEDENIRIKNFRDGIDIMVAIMLMKL